jgi:hypothetical protein
MLLNKELADNITPTVTDRKLLAAVRLNAGISIFKR